MNVSVTSNIKSLKKKLDDVSKRQLDFSVSKALNRIGFQVKDAVTKELPRYFDRPTTYLGKGLQVKKSDKKRLITQVGFRSPKFGRGQGSVFQSDIVRLSIKGGVRRPKGTAIPVPFTSNIKTNKYGNLARGKVKSLLSKPDKYFSGTPSGFKDSQGIWQRYGSKKNPKIKMVVGWEPTTTYKPGRFPFERIGTKTIKKNFNRELEKALKEALKTAR